MTHDGMSHLVHMANQIAQFFSSYPHDEAVAGISDHIRKFWDPRMRKQILAHVAGGGSGLNDLTLDALRRLS